MSLLSTAGTLCFMLVAVLLGKRSKKIRYTSYVAMVVIALLQVALVFYDMWSAEK